MKNDETTPRCYVCGRPFEEGERVCLDYDAQGDFQRFHEHCLE